ncbi:MAG: hypothetical protein ACXVCV_01375 [Polyangia bacterium]
MRLAPVALVLAMIGLAVAFGLAGCLGAPAAPASSTGGNGASQDAPADAAAAADLAESPDLAPRPLPPDLGSSDLAGLVDCFGATVCDPTTTFCIRLNTGSAANPGTIKTPACYEPVDCMGANMNCDCITQDPVLAPLCANCVDHMDGTYDCYAQP